MLLIMSGAYLNAEFTAEFGRFPPSFLPVGNRRLYQWQLDLFKDTSDRKVMSLPADFVVPETDARILAEANVEIVRTPEGLRLGEAVVFCLNVCRAYDEPLRLLHGDTLVYGVDLSVPDAVFVSPTREYYDWAEPRVDETGKVHIHEGLFQGSGSRDVLCGFFAFSEPALLIESILKSGNNFVQGLNAYSDIRPLELGRVTDWLDFGHVQLYYQSKSRMTTQRSFNQLHATKRAVVKSSDDTGKIAAEANWYETIPDNLRAYTPAFMGSIDTPGDRRGYRIEYLYLSTLSELFVFGRLPPFVWSQILSQCDEFLSLAGTHASPAPVLGAESSSYLTKTMARLEDFQCMTSSVHIDAPCTYAGKALPSMRRMVELCAEAIPDAAPADMSVWHGDFCFSNIFYDFRAHQIRTIDPRGRDFSGKPSIFGDRRYDVAKLAHSIVGRYDFIIAGHSRLVHGGRNDFNLELPANTYLEAIEDRFYQCEIGGYRMDEPWVMAMTITLFLSMLPLHADNDVRQMSLLANGLRLFAQMDGGSF